MLGMLTGAHVIVARPVLRTWLANGTKLRQTSRRRFATKCVMNRSIHNAPESDELRRYPDCSELKRRLKAEQKAKEKAEKEEAKTLAAAAQSKPSEKKDVKEEDISPNVNFL